MVSYNIAIITLIACDNLAVFHVYMLKHVIPLVRQLLSILIEYQTLRLLYLCKLGQNVCTLVLTLIVKDHHEFGYLTSAACSYSIGSLLCTAKLRNIIKSVSKLKQKLK